MAGFLQIYGMDLKYTTIQKYLLGYVSVKN